MASNACVIVAKHKLNKIAKGVKQMAEWIDFSKEQPKESGYYLCFHKLGNSYFEIEIMFWNEDSWSRSNSVTHWMPLPEPPQKERVTE